MMGYMHKEVGLTQDSETYYQFDLKMPDEAEKKGF